MSEPTEPKPEPIPPDFSEQEIKDIEELARQEQEKLKEKISKKRIKESRGKAIREAKVLRRMNPKQREKYYKKTFGNE